MARLAGLLLVVAMMTAGTRWLPPIEEPAVAATPAAAQLRPAVLNPFDGGDDPGARPVSASLCLALEDKLRALHLQASGELSEEEQLAVRSERRRSLAHMQALRCTGGDRSWF